MEPVEIDFIIGGNAATEGKKVEQTFDEITNSVNALTANIDRHKVAITALQKDLVELGVSYRQATKSQKSEILEEIELTKKNLIDERVQVRALTEEVRQLEKQKRAAGSATVDTATMANNAGKAAVGYNNLGFSVQQIVREMPAATMGMNMFFLAISNNLPILTDNIKRARAENELLKESGKSSVPVWKQLASSLFSWQSLMMVGITIMSMYGKDILAWVDKLFTGKSAIDKMAESQKAMNKVFSDFTGEAVRKIESVTKIGIEIQKYGNDSKNAKGIIDDFNKTFNTHLTTIEQVKAAYPGLSQAAITAAIKIQAANSLIEKTAQAVLKKQEADTKLSGYKKSTVKPYEDALDSVIEIMKKYGATTEQFNTLTSNLISGDQSMFSNLYDFIDPKKLKVGSKEFEGVYADFWGNMDKITKDKSGVFFAKYIAQQRKYQGMIGMENKEIMKILDGVDFKDFKPDPTKPDTNKDKTEKTYYDAAMAIRKMMLTVDKETADLLLAQEDDTLQRKLQQIDNSKKEEIDKIRLQQEEIINEYNKSHKNDKGNVPLSTKREDLVASLNVAAPGKQENGFTLAENMEKKITQMTDAYNLKRENLVADYYKNIVKKAEEMVDKRKKIENDYSAETTKLIKDAETAEKEAGTETKETKKKQLLDRAKADRQLAELLTAEEKKRVSEATVSILQETELYKTGMDERLNLSDQMTKKLIADIKARVQAERDAGKLSEADYRSMMSKLDNAEKTRKGNKNQQNPFAQLSDAIGGNTEAQNAVKNFDPTGLSPDEATAKLANLQSSANDATQAMAGAAGASLLGINQILDSAINGLDKLGMLSEQDKKDAENIMGMIGGAANLAMGIATGNPIQIIQGSIDLLVNAIEFFDFKNKELEKDQKKHLDNVKKLETQYKALENAVKNALGTDVYSAQRGEIENQKQQIADYEAWLADEYQKKKRKQDQAKIDETKQKIADLKQSIKEETDAIAAELAQTDAKSLANDLADSITSAFMNGEDAAKAFGDTADKVMQNAVKNALKLQFLEKPMKDAVDKLAADMADGTLTPAEQDAFRTAVTNAGKQYNDMLGQYADLFKGDTAAATGIKGDVAKMSEETGVALTGQITAMRLNVAELLSNSKNSLSAVFGILAALEEIKDNTAYCRKLERIDETLYYLKLNGLKAL